MRRIQIFVAPLLLSAAVFGADAPKVPEKVDKALRSRVNEFFQYHVDKNFRKAMDLVAEDTKDEYFASGKMVLKSFTLDDIKYSDRFDKAVVTTTVVRDWEFRMQVSTVTLPMTTTWKLEHGKWVWYRDKDHKDEWLTPMGKSDFSSIRPNPDGTVTLPKINQDSVLAAARKIMQSSGVDHLDVRFDSTKDGTDRIVFTNGAQGSVRLEMTPMNPLPGLTYKFDKTEVGAGETATLSIEYKAGNRPPPQIYQIPFEVVPFNTTYTVSIRFDSVLQ